MKKHKRSRSGKNQRSLSASILNWTNGRAKRPRKSWIFERLEDRHLFSATPIGSPSSVLTSEQVFMGEMYWAFKQASNLSQYTTEQLQNTTQWAIWTVDPSSGNSVENFNPYAGGSTISTLLTGDIPLDEVLAGFAQSQTLVMAYPIVDEAMTIAPQSFLDEPLFESQWHIRNTGQLTSNPIFNNLGVPGEDARVVGAWNQNVSGAGVIVGVVDSGIQPSHPDLSDNYRADLSKNFAGGLSNDQSHGTAVAGIIGADGDNGIGAVGIAPNAQLASLTVGGSFGFSTTAIIDAITYRNDAIDIYNHSWGEAVDGREYIPVSPLILAALRRSVLFGRPGPDGTPLGNIHIKSSGNDAGHSIDVNTEILGTGNWDNASYDGRHAIRYWIVVGGVDHDGSYENVDDGTVTNYMEMGPSVLVVAPTGSFSLDVGLDTGAGSGIWTTDLIGDNGYNEPGTDDNDFLDDTNYTSRFNGTSAAAPMVSGVVALMLEANPNLTYRDVQEILLRSARQNDPTHESWQVNLHQLFEDPELVTVTVPMDEEEGEPDPEEPPPEPVEVDVPAEDPFQTPFSPSPSNYNFLEADPPLGPIPGINDYTIYQRPQYTNGAGYTVSASRGRFSEGIGYAHGVVDAELAVRMAKNWHTYNQDLAKEVNYTTFLRLPAARIAPAAVVGPDGVDIVIPGGLTGPGELSFPEFYEEFWAEDPFDLEGVEGQGDLPSNDRNTNIQLESLPGFSPPDMKVETVEVRVQIAGATADGIDQLRIVLRSPDGTISDLNQFMIHSVTQQTENDTAVGGRFTPGTSPYNGEGDFVFTALTNRHWGERIGADTVYNPSAPENTNPYEARGWELIFENYSGADMTLVSFEVVFHGTEVQGERVSGKVGVDAGKNGFGLDDGSFNFDRFIEVDVVGPFVPPAVPGPDIYDDRNDDGYIDLFVVDQNQEPFASNVLVRARNVLNPDFVVAQFLTGADGNFYFDLADGQYIIDIVDPLGREIKDGGPNYQSSYTITVGEFSLGSLGRTARYDDGSRIDDLNFLLGPGDLPVQAVDVSGFVFSDANANGKYDSSGGVSDSPAVGFRVYADLNRSGQFEANEPFALTDNQGNYQFTIAPVSQLQDFVIVVDPPNGQWIATNPQGGRQTITGDPGVPIADVDFGFKPPANTPPGGGPGAPGDPGTIQGTVFNDRNGNGAFNSGPDMPVAGVIVYIDEIDDDVFSFHDANQNGQYDSGEQALERYAITASTGGYTLGVVPPGQDYEIRVVAPQDWQVTAPAAGFHLVDVENGGQTNFVSFGIQNLATHDFGDLPDSYNTTLTPGDPDNNGPRHQVFPGFRLGNLIDGEINGKPSDGADGDDDAGLTGDDDGVVLPSGSLTAGQTNVLQVTVFGVGGYLNAWFDVDRDGQFSDDEHLIVDDSLYPGVRSVEVELPDVVGSDPIAARFRWGAAGLNYFGAATIGEVEDYYLPIIGSPAVASALPGDYDNDGFVGNSDYTAWKQSFGSQNLAADGNGDGVVDALDYTVWRNNYGNSLPASASGSGGLSLLAAVVSDVSETESEAGANSSGKFGFGFVPFETVASPLHSTPSALREFTLTTVASDTQLELLDRVLAVVGSVESDDADESAGVSAFDTDSESEEAVFAQAFDEVTDWRYEL